MNDIQVWDKMLLEDLNTSILVEELGLDKTIELYRTNKEEEELKKILSHNYKL